MISPDTPPRSAPISSRLPRGATAWLALLGLVLLVHASGLVGPLVFDDEHAVRDNTAIRDLANVPAFFVDPDMFSATAGRMYRPLVLTSLAVDHWIGGGAAWAFRLGNLLQHLVMVALLFVTVPRLLERCGFPAQRRELARWLITLLFALHPLHVESLCLVSSRSEILMAIGLMIALLSCLSFDGTRGSSRPLLRITGIAVGTAWACLSKETGVLVPPFVGLVLLLIHLQGSSSGMSSTRRALWRSFWPAASALPVALVYLVLRKTLFGVATIGARAFQSGGDPYAGGSRDMETQLLAMTQFLPKALLLWLFPAQLNIDHTRFEPLTWTEPSVLLGIAVIALPLLLALLWLRKRSLFSIGVLGAMAFALPWILVPLNVPLAEHRLYVPVLLLSIPAGAALSRLELASILVSRARWLAFAPVLILGLLSVRSVFRSLDWHEPKQLWQSALSKNDQSFRACCGLADLEREAGRLRASIAHLEAANTIYPRYLPARRNECEIWLRIAELGQASPGEVAHMVQIVEAFAEERWKDPFVRLQASRARIAAYRVNSDAADLRKARSWALSCLAMVERKMLVYQQASESERAGQDFEQALALFDTCREHGLENPLFLAAMGDCLVEAEAYPEAGRLLRSLTNSPVTESCVLGFAVRLAEATQDARLLHWAKGGLMQLQFGVAVPPR